ncbi:stage II sporulation protein R [Clostridium sp. MD294]|uniref:stage II sporulation protein R n=1 Tax=Clostridium sp. MD294 TaxID=97138 RepID=UPI0002CA74B9|nr:stage II sporulation protein R [Clostridium sp. MD294]NDO47313.1 stage II sporulation protein R [Clostridium sp. MD294]USF29618.1 hypothetical protein C820_001018 [Clostridium sp. MD294]
MKGLAYTYYRTKYILKMEKKNIVWCCIFTLIFLLCCTVYATKVYSEHIQSGIAQKVIRFHVLANSDAENDQNLKLAVRDAILQQLGEELEKYHDKEETKKYLKNNMDRIKNIALQEITRQGYDYDVKVSLENTVFPLKKYGELSFPAGMYEALRVEIGEAKGKNWWCVVYPPLCYVDVACSEVTEESKIRLQGSLTEEEFCIVDNAEQEISTNVKFKIVEWWQERK